MPGVFAQTVLFGSAFTGIGIAEDMTKGIIDRLRSLPMFQPGVLIGRTVSDLVRNLFTFVVMLVVALLIGFRFEGGLARRAGRDRAPARLQLRLLVAAGVDRLVGEVGGGGQLGRVHLDVPADVRVVCLRLPPTPCPAGCRPSPTANPFTQLTNAARALYNGSDPGSSLWIATLWAIGITAVFATLASRKYSHSTSR